MNKCANCRNWNKSSGKCQRLPFLVYDTNRITPIVDDMPRAKFEIRTGRDFCCKFHDARV